MKRRLALLGALSLPLVLIAGLVVIPAASPAAGARVADLLRELVGPQPVVELESLSNRIRDDINRLRYRYVQAPPQISWSATATPSPDQPGPVALPAPARSSSTRTSLAPAANVLSAPPQIGWQSYGSYIGDTPALARAMVLVDPQRSYAGVALVRMDLRLLELHMMPGIIEPAHPSGIAHAFPSLGSVPPADRSGLMAAFNGGFKAVHGHYGMMANGITLLEPVSGMATIAVYKDGSVRMGAWGQDLLPSPDIVAFRQNCPPLIDAGVLNPALSTDATKAWGFTHNTDITWRTGLGLSQDGRYLIYGVGNGTDAKFLARALQQAGAYSAMQLDINQYYAQFVTYSQNHGELVGQHLLDQMTNNPQQFLAPDIRDFFYVTLR